IYGNINTSGIGSIPISMVFLLDETGSYCFSPQCGQTMLILNRIITLNVCFHDHTAPQFCHVGTGFFPPFPSQYSNQSYEIRVPFATGSSGRNSTTSSASCTPPITNTSDLKRAIRIGGKFTTPTTCRPTS